MKLRIHRSVLDDISRTIAAHPPERGGALLGPVGEDTVSYFVYDKDAATTGFTYQPSESLASHVQDIERNEPLEFKGLVHSHPAGIPLPSGQDVHELGVGLSLNPHMLSYLAPIVICGDQHVTCEYEVPLEHGKMGCFVAKLRAGRTRVEPVTVNVVGDAAHRLLQALVSEHVALLCKTLDCPHEATIAEAEIAGARTVSAELQAPGSEGPLELLLLFGEVYPLVPPALLITEQGAVTEQHSLQWSLETAEEDRLVESVTRIVRPPGPYARGWAPPGGRALTIDPRKAALAGWECVYSNVNAADEAAALQEALYARSMGLLSKALSNASVLVVGAGSAGSYLTEQLARSGVGRLHLIDDDIVIAPNLCRTPYAIGDVGRTKVMALARRCLNINPLLDVLPDPRRLQDIPNQQLLSAIGECDLVVAAADDIEAQRQLNLLAYHLERPLISVGLYEGAKGGEVIVCVPGRSPCLLCAAASRYSLDVESVEADTDYGTGRLVSEVALGADIHHVISAAVKLALSLLLPADAEASLKCFVREILERGITYLTFGMVPNYWFYPTVFAETLGQHAYQSVWLRPVHNPECPVCGDPAHRTAIPESFSRPSATALRAVAATLPLSVSKETTPADGSAPNSLESAGSAADAGPAARSSCSADAGSAEPTDSPGAAHSIE